MLAALAFIVGIGERIEAPVSTDTGHTPDSNDLQLVVGIGVEILQRTGADNVGGPMHPVGGGVFGDAVATAMSSRFDGVGLDGGQPRVEA